MPESEFEVYISLLSRFLRLSADQRAGIADELRDHLEARLEELAARGVPREQAIRTALDEFGDAAELAQHFTRAAHLRRRRLIMRCTVGTVAALVAALLIATAFWPGVPDGPIPARSVAQNVAPPVHAPNPMKEAAQMRHARLVESLDKPTTVNFFDVPLEEAINFLKEYHSIPVWIDRQAMKDEGISPEQPVTLQLDGITFRSVLKLLLSPAGLTYLFEDEVMKITTSSNAGVIQVYNVRDLVLDRSVTGTDAEAANALVPGIAKATPAEKSAAQPGGARKPGSDASAPKSNSLADVVSRTVSPETWHGQFGGDGVGVIIEYNGLLVVTNSDMVHGQVEKLLNMMRAAIQSRRDAAAGKP